MTEPPDDLDAPDPLDADAAQPESAAAHPLWPVVRDALAEREWVYDELAPGTVLARVRGDAANYDVFLGALESIAVLRCTIALHVYVTEAWRASTCDLINRINHGELVIGAFEMDPESGRLRWRLAYDVEDGVLSTTMVHNAIAAGLHACDRFFPALMAVSVLGTSPEAALKLVTEG